MSSFSIPPPLFCLLMSEAILCPPQGPITNKAGVWAQGMAGRGCLRLSLPYCRLLWRSNTLTVAWSNAPMQKHINTCGLCDQPPVHRMDAHTHVMVTKTTEAQVAACTHKSMWSTVMCVAGTTHTHRHTLPCVQVTFRCIPLFL